MSTREQPERELEPIAICAIEAAARSPGADGRWLAVLDGLPHGLVLFDPSDRRLYWNAAARRLYGLSGPADAPLRLADLASRLEVATLEGRALPAEAWPLMRLLRGEPVEDRELLVRALASTRRRVLRHKEAHAPANGAAPWRILSVEEVPAGAAASDAMTHLVELERLGRLHAALKQINRAITRAPPRSELFSQVCEALVEEGGFALAWIGWRATDTPLLVPEAAAGRERGYLDRIHVYADDRTEGRGPTGLAFREARPYVCNDVGSDAGTLPWREAYRRHGFESSAAFPVRVGGEVGGVLTVYAYERHYFREEEVSLLVEAAADLSFALDFDAAEAERRRAQAAEHRELAFSTALLESLPGVFYFYDAHGRFLRWNRNFESVTGYRGEEIAQMHPLDFIAADDRPAVAARIDRVFAEGEGTVEAGVASKDGSVTPYFFTGRRIHVDGRPHLLGMGLDIADRKRAEREIRRFTTELEERVAERTGQLEHANKELEAFSYSVSHDLRAPLRAVNGLAEIVLADHAEQLPEEGRRLLQRIRERAVHMGHLIDDLLAFSRLGRQPLQVRDVDMPGLVRRAIEELAPQYEGRAVEFTLEDLPRCRADPKLIYLVWLNLLSNAVKYSRGRTRARVRIGAIREERGSAYFVEDNGAGFDMRYADKLFGVFQRLHRADEFEGTGVGLAIVQSIVQRHGGRAWAVAEEGRGATFHFTLG